MSNVLEYYRHFEQELAGFNRPGRFDAGRDLGVERIAHLLKLLGNPQHAFPIIHVGGTAGKGSTATTVAAILATAGYTTGLHLSPALQILNEGFQINGRMVGITRLAGLLAAIKPAIRQVELDTRAGLPTAFEVQVALALDLFQQEAVDVAVVETGLGGADDATSVVTAAVAVLTSIGLDHTEVFGDTIAAVAQAEAGIIKPGQQVISGVQQPQAQQVIARRCGEVGATLWQVGREYGYVADGEGGFSLYTPDRVFTGLHTGMAGEFQQANAACAVAAVQALPGFCITEAAVREGVQRARLPGRMEIMQQNPTLMLDGAHSPDKLHALGQAFDRLYGGRRRIVVFALKADKPLHACVELMVHIADLLIITTFRDRGLWRAHDPLVLAEVARELAPDLALHIVVDAQAALDVALAAARPADVILVSGSLYLVGDVRERWYPALELLRQAEGM